MAEVGRNALLCGKVVVMAEWMVLHSYEVDTNCDGYLGSEGFRSQARPPNPGFPHWEDKSPLPLVVRNCQIFTLQGPTQT